MSNTNNTMQTQTSNTLHNAIMEASGKDRPPMLAPCNYVQWKSRIKRYIDTKPNHELIHHCLKNLPYEYTGIDNDIYSIVDACPNACEMWKAIKRLKQGESINVQDLKTNLYWEFGKFTSRDGESLESYYSRFYKMMNELVRNQCDVTNHQVNVQFLLQLQPEWKRFMTLVKQSQELKTVSYHKLCDILKQHQNEVNEIRVERLARLETANAAQQLEIVKLKARVKKLERLNKVKSSKLKRLKKVVAANAPIPAAKPKILKIAAAPAPMKKKDQVEMDAEYAKKLQEELNKEHEEAYKKIDWNAAFDHVQAKETQYIKRYLRFKKKPQSVSEARKNMISYLKNTEGYKMEFFKGKTYDQILLIFQARFDANLKFLFKSKEEIEKEDEEIIKNINETPAQKAAKRRKLSEEAQEADDLKKRLGIVQDEDDDVFVEAITLAQKVPVVDYQVIVIDNKPRYKIIRADDTHQFYISFITLLKNFDREDLETLGRIVKDRLSTKKLTNFSDEYLLLTLKTMFRELDEQDAIWRNQKSVQAKVKAVQDAAAAAHTK
nr:hypothetical protein [Tanacetum cinerariifolium]